MASPALESARSAELVQVPDLWYPAYVEEHHQDLTGRVAVVTGANSGTGYWAAAAMARLGATVVLACRSTQKASAAKEEIVGSMQLLRSELPIPTENVVVIQCDNMSFASVRAFAAEFRTKFKRLDFLLLNAGIMAQSYTLSEDGHDVQLQTNHLAHFLLAKELWPTIASTKAMPNDPLQPVTPRVVCMSSMAHVFGWPKFDPARIDCPPHGCGAGILWLLLPCVQGLGIERSAWKRYGTSKLACVAFMSELARRLRVGLPDGQCPQTLVVGAHPGYASTGLQKKAGDHGNLDGWEKNNSDAQSAADGSLPMLMACLLTEQELQGGGADGHVWKGGEYIGPQGSNMSFKGPPARTPRVGGFGEDPSQADLVWKYSEQACGVFPEISGAA